MDGRFNNNIAGLCGTYSQQQIFTPQAYNPQAQMPFLNQPMHQYVNPGMAITHSQAILHPQAVMQPQSVPRAEGYSQRNRHQHRNQASNRAAKKRGFCDECTKKTEQLRKADRDYSEERKYRKKVQADLKAEKHRNSTLAKTHSEEMEAKKKAVKEYQLKEKNLDKRIKSLEETGIAQENIIKELQAKVMMSIVSSAVPSTDAVAQAEPSDNGEESNNILGLDTTPGSLVATEKPPNENVMADGNEI